MVTWFPGDIPVIYSLRLILAQTLSADLACCNKVEPSFPTCSFSSACIHFIYIKVAISISATSLSTFWKGSIIIHAVRLADIHADDCPCGITLLFPENLEYTRK